MQSQIVQSTMRITKALADLQRVRILMMLQPGELCVCQIVEVLALAPSTVSKHLSILSAAQLVDSRKEGRWAYYRLPEGPAAVFAGPVLEWLRRAVKDDDVILRDLEELQAVVASDPGALCRRQRGRDGKREKNVSPG